MDRFDDIWKNRFNDGKLPIDEWNSPDDELVWSGIESGIAPKKERRRWLWLWWGLGLLLATMLLGFFLIKSSGSTSPLGDSETVDVVEKVEVITANKNEEKEQLNQNSKLIEDLSVNELNPTNYNSSIDKKVAKGKTLASKKNTVESHASSRTLSTQATTPKSNATNNFVEKSETTLKNQLVSDSNVKEQQVLVSQESKSGGAEGKSQDLEQKKITVPVLSVPISMLETVAPTIEYVSVLKDLPEETTNAKLALSLNTGIVYWQHRISSSYTTDLSPFDFNYSDNFGWQTSLNFAYPINDYLKVFGAVQYEQIKSTSGHNSNLVYDVAGEDNASNTYTQSLATPYGLSEATFQLNRVRNVAADEVDLLVDFKSDHLIQNWSLPLGVQVAPLAGNTKLQPVASLAFGINYLTDISNTINSIASNHDAIDYGNREASIFEKPDLKNWHYDLRLGLGLNYQIKPSLQIGLSYDWTRGLSPIFQLKNASSIQENYETRIDRHHISLSIVKMLGL